MRDDLSDQRSVHGMSACFCGLDVHKEYTYATVLGPDGDVVSQGRMPNEEVSSYLKPYPVGHVAMESSTTIAPLYRKLTDEGYDVLVSHPKKTRILLRQR
ncbi:MAG: hypothetical protein ACLFVP_09095 [Candidatus Bathyarchaeia archaeon]